MLTIITGGSGSGKTTFCRHLADQARTAGQDVAGILSPAVYEGGQKVAIEALDLRTGEHRPLARLRTEPDDSADPLTPAWVFDAAALAWANDVLAGATPCDVLIVDEMGPLELKGGQGWTAGVAAVSSSAYRHALVVVRPGLLSQAWALWPQARLVDTTHSWESLDLARDWPAS